MLDDSFLLLINVDTADPLLARTRRRASGPGDRQRVTDCSMRVLRRIH